MPEIPEYNAPIKGLTVPATGIETTANAARRLGALGAERGDAIAQEGKAIAAGLENVGRNTEKLGSALNAHDTTQDILHGSSAFADAQFALSAKYQNALANADPNDTNFGKRFFDEQVTPAIDDLQSGFQTPAGRRWAAEHGEAVAQHWTNQIIQGQSQLAGQAAKGNIENILLKSTAQVQTDPSHLPLVLDQMRSSYSMAAQTGNLTPQERGHISGPGLATDQKNLIKVAGEAMIDRDPNVDMSGFFKTYGERMGGEEVHRLTTYQTARQRSALEQQRSDDHQVKTLQAEAADQQVSQALTSVIQPDGRLAVPQGYFDHITAIQHMPGAKSGEIERAINFGKAINDENASGKMDTTDPATRSRFDSRLYDTQNPLTAQDIYEAKIRHQLSSEDFKAYLGYAEQAQKPGMKAENEQIKANQLIAHDFFMPKNPATGMPNILLDPNTGEVRSANPEGPTAIAMFNSQFNAGVAKARAAGTLTEYLTPGNTLYWGKSINLPAIRDAAKAQFGNTTATAPQEATPEKKVPFGDWLGKNLGGIFK